MSYLDPEALAKELAAECAHSFDPQHMTCGENLQHYTHTEDARKVAQSAWLALKLEDASFYGWLDGYKAGFERAAKLRRDGAS